MSKLIFELYRFIFARRIFYRMNRFFFRLSSSGLGILNYENLSLSGERAFLTGYFKDRKNAIVLDVGANEGTYSELIKKLAPSTRIICFEPHPKTFEKLKVCAYKNDLEVYKVAVGSSSARELKLYDRSSNDGSVHASLYKDVIETIHKESAVAHTVEVISLDDFASSSNISYVDLLKIDTEGHEMEVLKGFMGFVSAGKVRAIQFEFGEMNVISRVFFRDFFELLASYRLYRMLPDGLVPIDNYSPMMCEIFAYQNIVAISNHQ